MKMTKNSIPLLFILFFTTSLAAQTFGFRSGMNMSKMLFKSSTTVLSKDDNLYFGFQFGPTVDVPVEGRFSIETGLLASSKGYRRTLRVSGFAEIVDKVKFNIYYLDIPFNGKFSHSFGKIKLFGFSGAYLGVGLFGRKTSYNNFTEERIKSDIQLGSEKGKHDLKRLDYGLNFGLGTGIKNLEFGFNYALGLANLSVFPENGKIKHRVAHIFVAWRFRNKSKKEEN